jgi:Zn2+/Cd2+-exporting ATPase
MSKQTGGVTIDRNGRMEKFRIRNVDCAACAAKIESGLLKVPGVDQAVLDFATLTLHLKADDMGKVIDELHRIEPFADLVLDGDESDSDNADHHEKGYMQAFDPKREGSVLAVAILMFVFILVFEKRIHDNFGPFFEYAVVLAAYLLAGWNVITGAVKTVLRKNFFDENVLMVIATAGAIAVHAVTEAVGVMIFFKIGEFLQNLAVSRSRRSIRALLAARPDLANLKTDSGIRSVKPEQVGVDDLIVVRPGEKIPLDGVVISGISQLDTSALTGEPVPVSVKTGSGALAGQVNLTGALTIKVTRPFKDSSISRVLDLVENAVARKAKTEKFITTFARYYTPAVVIAALCIAFIPPLVLKDQTFAAWIYRALVLLVISCPCALVVSIPLGYFGGIGLASRNGILVKGSNVLDTLSRLKTVVFDKTGTLTEGVFDVKEVISANGYSADALLEFAAIAEYHSTHPIAKSILKAYQEKGGEVNPSGILSHSEFSGSGVRVQIDDRIILVGSDALMHREKIVHDRCVFDDTAVHVSVNHRYAGYILVGDRIRPESAEAISLLRDQGVENIVLLTGDNKCAAASVAKRLKIDAYYAELLPEDKVAVFDTLEKEKSHDGKIAFIGDGINDAPVIARADVGMAMGGLGSDAAIETADVVIMNDNLRKAAEAIRIGRQTRRIVWQNIILAFSIKGFFIIFGAMGLATMWEAVFADVGTALLAVVNSTRILRKRDMNRKERKYYEKPE